jgi:DNA-binding transcriptional ArsR family regulator
MTLPVNDCHVLHRDGVARTKTAALAEILRQPAMLKRIGPAWQLYFRLVLDGEGSAAGTRDEIGERLGEDGRNVSNWVSSLHEAGIVTVEKTGRRMKVTLTGIHMDAARMPDAVTVVKESEPSSPAIDDRRRNVLELMDRARALGGEAEVRIVVKTT